MTADFERQRVFLPQFITFVDYEIAYGA